MKLGNFDTPITILETRYKKDSEGFASPINVPIACVRACVEVKNTSEKWANNAMLQDVSALFRIRYIPNRVITTDMLIECHLGKFNIASIENIRGRNMYIEILAKKVVPNAKGNNEAAR